VTFSVILKKEFLLLSYKMFSTFTVKQLKALIKQFKDHHKIKNYSKLKKAQLVEQLESRFEIKDNQLYLKNAPTVEPKAKRTKRAVQPAVVPQAPQAPQAAQKQDGLTAGQRTLQNKINAIEQKAKASENYKKDSNFANRLRGNN
jgi:hypothetical protein